MKRLFLVFFVFVAALCHAEETYLGIYIGGSKTGYMQNVTAPDTLNGVSVTKTDSATVFNSGLLGQAVKMEIKATTWTDSSGKPLRMKTTVISAGRSQIVDATFSAETVQVTIDNSGEVTKKTLPIPKDGKIVDDAVMALLAEQVQPGATKVFYALDPMTATLVKNTVKLVGKAQAMVRGLPFDATLIEVSEPRATMKVYVSAKGDLIKAEGPMLMELIPMSKEEALATEPGGGFSDLALLSRIKVDKPLGDVARLAKARFRFSGADTRSFPNTSHQTAQKQGGDWLIETLLSAPAPSRSASIAKAKAFQPNWVKPGLNIPSSSKKFIALAKTIVGKTTNAADASIKIRKWVTAQMKPNASIGVLRDATEVLKTKEGVCRDYAILTATLLRAAGIPAKLSSGLVYMDGAFYYHAWVMAFDGKSWFGVDSTRPDGLVTPGHVQLAEGSVEDAFTFSFLDQATAEVLELIAKGQR